MKSYFGKKVSKKYLMLLEWFFLKECTPQDTFLLPLIRRYFLAFLAISASYLSTIVVITIMVTTVTTGNIFHLKTLISRIIECNSASQWLQKLPRYSGTFHRISKNYKYFLVIYTKHNNYVKVSVYKWE
jgi:hypothetical protein